MERRDGRLAKWAPAVLFAAAFVALWVFLERTQLYLFHYREQQQVFLLDWQYVLGLLKRPGGVSLALSQALVQFFPLPLVGSAVTALLGILAGAALWGVCRRIKEIPWLLPLCLVTVPDSLCLVVPLCLVVVPDWLWRELLPLCTDCRLQPCLPPRRCFCRDYAASWPHWLPQRLLR